jgi:phospholipid/cholesterol/gamma-HCH transport system substrate-binding protein
VRVRRAMLAPVALALMIGLASCGGSGVPKRTASAVFSNIGDLANGAQVQLAGVPVGAVSAIGLDGDRARITMTLNSGVRIPANVSASIARTTILGDQYVQLTVPKSDVGPASGHEAQLASGAMIHHTSLVPDVEQFVQAGSDVFGAISTTQLEQIIEAGGEGFTGQAASLKAFLTDLSTVTNGYAQHTSEITQAVNGLNQISATLAPSSTSNANALTTLSKTVAILAQNSNQFESLLQSLNNLSVQGRSILETYYPQIVTQLQALEAVTGQVSQHQSDLAGLLQELPIANTALPSGVRNGYVQLYENIIVCGIPAGGEDDSSPAFSCAKTGGGS